MVKRRYLLALIVLVLLPVLCSSATTDAVESKSHVRSEI